MSHFMPDSSSAPDKVDVTGASVEFTIELVAGRPYRIFSTVNAWLNYGAAATVGDSSEFVGKGVPYDITCPPGYHGLKAQLIKDTGEPDGRASITRGRRVRMS